MTDEIAVADVSNAAPPVEAVSEAPPERSMDDTLAATFEAMKARRPEHGEDGKFQAKAGAETATPALQVPGSPEAAPPEPTKSAIEAPQSLPADVRAEWNALPPKVQEYWASRESEIHKKITTDGERLKSLVAYEDISTAVQDRLREVNASAPDYFRNLHEADRLLAKDGVAGVLKVVGMYGVDLRAVMAAAGMSPNGQPADPQFNALSQELGAIKSHLTAQQQAAEQAKVAEAKAKIEAFKKNAPHFDKVEALMTKMYEPGMDLAQLYDMATRAHPEVSKVISAEQEAKAKADALAKQKADAAAAAKLATQSRKPGSVGVIAKAGGSWEDSMAATFRGIRARG